MQLQPSLALWPLSFLFAPIKVLYLRYLTYLTYLSYFTLLFMLQPVARSPVARALNWMNRRHEVPAEVQRLTYNSTVGKAIRSRRVGAKTCPNSTILKVLSPIHSLLYLPTLLYYYYYPLLCPIECIYLTLVFIQPHLSAHTDIIIFPNSIPHTHTHIHTHIHKTSVHSFKKNKFPHHFQSFKKASIDATISKPHLPSTRSRRQPPTCFRVLSIYAIEQSLLCFNPQPHPLGSIPFRRDIFSPNAAAQSRYGESDTGQSYMLILNPGHPLASTAEPPSYSRIE